MSISIQFSSMSNWLLGITSFEGWEEYDDGGTAEYFMLSFGFLLFSINIASYK